MSAARDKAFKKYYSDLGYLSDGGYDEQCSFDAFKAGWKAQQKRIDKILKEVQKIKDEFDKP